MVARDSDPGRIIIAISFWKLEARSWRLEISLTPCRTNSGPTLLTPPSLSVVLRRAGPFAAKILFAPLTNPACANPKCFGGQAPEKGPIRIGRSPLFSMSGDNF